MAAKLTHPYGLPRKPRIKGAMLVAIRKALTKIAPAGEPKALLRDFPYPALISLQDAYIRVSAISEPFTTVPEAPVAINSRAKKTSSMTACFTD